MLWRVLSAAVLVSLCTVSHMQGSDDPPSKDIPVSSFSCIGRPTGYYADTETGCQVYHMCDESGRQFSYSCPNTTLFHQRMLICAHWYQVNCSRSEFDYDANLLIGQRDKPFISETEHKYFYYRKRPASYGVPRTEASGGTTQSTNTANTIQLVSHEFNSFQAATVESATTTRQANAQDDTPLQNTTGSKDFQHVNVFIDRFVPPHTASGYEQLLEKNVYINDFKIEDTSLGIPSMYLQPPRYKSIKENNKIELVFEDPRRIFYIGENGSDSVKAEPVLVTIRLNKRQMLFRNRNQHSCDKCHPLFVVNKDTCKPCVVVR